MRANAILIIGTAIILAAGCNKSMTNSDLSMENLKSPEVVLKQDYSQGQQYENLLAERHKTSGMTLTDQTCKMYDSLYHMYDTSFTMHFHEYCLEMMEMNEMESGGMMSGSGGMMSGSGGMMGGSGSMMCNMDSMMMMMGNMTNMNTFMMDSMMLIHLTNCPSMGTMTNNMVVMVNNMQTMRKEHANLHK